MTVRTTPHINFHGEAREALEFYAALFGAQAMIASYADIHAVEDPAQAHHVAFGRVTAPNGFDVMAYDVQPSKQFDAGVNAFYITLQSSDETEVTSAWNALADGARTILTPFGPAPFAPLYGMLTDRFGVTWIIGLEPEAPAA